MPDNGGNNRRVLVGKWPVQTAAHERKPCSPTGRRFPAVPPSLYPALSGRTPRSSLFPYTSCILAHQTPFGNSFFGKTKKTQPERSWSFICSTPSFSFYKFRLCRSSFTENQQSLFMLTIIYRIKNNPTGKLLAASMETSPIRNHKNYPETIPLAHWRRLCLCIKRINHLKFTPLCCVFVWRNNCHLFCT